MKKFKKNTRSKLATWLGALTSLILIVQNFDFDAFDTHSMNQWVKLGSLLLPAIGGWMSEVKGGTLNEQAGN